MVISSQFPPRSYHYFPILKAKQGEISAIAGFKDPVLRQATPIFYLPSPLIKQRKDKADRECEEEIIRRAAAELSSSFDFQRNWHFYLDTSLVEIPNWRLCGEEPLRRMFRLLNHLDTLFPNETRCVFPVTGPERSPGHLQALGEILSENDSQCLVRIPRAHWPSAVPYLQDLVQNPNFNPAAAELLIDCGFLKNAAEVRLCTAEVEQLLQEVPHLSEWRMIILGAGAFPKSLSGVHPHMLRPFPRLEWTLWGNLRESLMHSHDKRIHFADYSTEHPVPDRNPHSGASPKGADGKSLSFPPTVRYTLLEDFIITKGHRTATTEHPNVSRQHQALADLIRQCDGFRESDSGFGESRISVISQQQDANTTHMEWRRITTIQHVCYLSRLVSEQN